MIEDIGVTEHFCHTYTRIWRFLISRYRNHKKTRRATAACNVQQASSMLCVRNDRNYNGFGEPMDRHHIKVLIKPLEFKAFLNLWLVHEFNISIKPIENQWFWKAHRNAYDILIEIHTEFKASLNLWTQNLNNTIGKSMIFHLQSIWSRAESGSGAPGPKSAPRDTKSTTCA